MKTGLNIHPEAIVVLVRGGGDLGSGTAHRLHRAGFRVVVSELPQPTVIRRAVAFASAVYEGSVEVEGVLARLAQDVSEARALLQDDIVPVVIDATGEALRLLQPHVVVDARLAKCSLGTTLADAAIVVGLGPGFCAGRDAHAVIETNRGHNLGRVILHGSAQPDTSVPGLVRGYGRERVLWAPADGPFRGLQPIGSHVEKDQIVAMAGEEPVKPSISGVLRGILHDDLWVEEGQKVGDVDPRSIVEHCFTISDKARAIGGGVLEAILYLRHHLTASPYHAKLQLERRGQDGL
jgi:xanthine dehydrogenase accessory factor